MLNYKRMNDTELNIAITELRGWKFLKPKERKGANPSIVYPEDLPRWKKGREVIYADDIPEYCEDLNACHEVEVSLDEIKHDAFQQHLLEIVAPGTHWSDMAVTRIVSATARQRAEALYLTLK